MRLVDTLAAAAAAAAASAVVSVADADERPAGLQSANAGPTP